jgi:hypothetical protein
VARSEGFEPPTPGSEDQSKPWQLAQIEATSAGFVSGTRLHFGNIRDQRQALANIVLAKCLQFVTPAALSRAGSDGRLLRDDGEWLIPAMHSRAAAWRTGARIVALGLEGLAALFAGAGVDLTAADSLATSAFAIDCPFAGGMVLEPVIHRIRVIDPERTAAVLAGYVHDLHSPQCNRYR